MYSEHKKDRKELWKNLNLSFHPYNETPTMSHGGETTVIGDIAGNQTEEVLGVTLVRETKNKQAHTLSLRDRQ